MIIVIAEQRDGKLNRATWETIAAAQQMDGDITVLVSRMLPIVRTFISIPAGIARMPLWRFVAFSVIGAIPWVMLLVWGGVVLGDHWVDIKRSFAGLDYLVAAVILGAIALFVWRHVRAR